jgi:inorganic pyrophosphatase/exopolyphosphatase
LVFKPKQIKNIKIIYEKPISKRKKTEDIIDSIPVDLLNQCAKVLSGYGFDLDEAKELIKQSYNSCKTNDVGSLIKNVLKSFGEKNG